MVNYWIVHTGVIVRFMSEFCLNGGIIMEDSVNYAEYTVEQKSEGAHKKKRMLLISPLRLVLTPTTLSLGLGGRILVPVGTLMVVIVLDDDPLRSRGCGGAVRTG